MKSLGPVTCTLHELYHSEFGLIFWSYSIHAHVLTKTVYIFVQINALQHFVLWKTTLQFFFYHFQLLKIIEAGKKISRIFSPRLVRKKETEQER